MLVWSRPGRFLVWLVAALLIGVIFIAPLAVILAASLARQWNGVLPTGFTLEHYAAAGSGALGDSVFAYRGRRWLCALKGRRGAEYWASFSSFQAPCRRCRWDWASWSRSASGR